MTNKPTIKDCMKQAQIFASAWGRVGSGVFGTTMGHATAEKEALEAMLRTALAAPAQPAPAPGAPSDSPHAELRKTWREGQRWQTRGDPEWEWLDTTPCWWPGQEYRRHPDDFDAAAPDQAGEQKRLPLAITSAPDRIFLDLGCNPYEEDAHFSELHEVTWSQDNATGNGIEYVRADCAARGAAQAAPTFAAKLPSPANVGTAPKCLNLNDQAMWVLGWNECLDAASAAQKGGA